MQAIAAFRQRPENFGALRRYLGKSTLALNGRSVRRLAERLYKLKASQAPQSTS